MSLYQTTLKQITSNQDLSQTDSETCLAEIFSGKWTPDETATFLEALRQKGESVSEIVGFAQTLKKHMIPVQGIPLAIDLCGTGGGPAHRYNVSTAAAFVLASLGVGVAKHGNRGSRSPNGSFDFIEALGIPILTDTQKLPILFAKFNLCFLYARAHHPIMASVAEARRKVGGRSIFNLIGPLCNPAGAKRQVLGVSDHALGLKLATATKALGQTHVLIVAGDSGYDEITPFGHTQLWDMTDTQCQTIDFQASEIFTCTPDSLRMSDMQQTLKETKDAFSGKETAIARYIALNAGAALYTSEKVKNIDDGILLAKETLQSGQAWDFLQRYIAEAKKHVAQ
jgi:anthranilate phosphoribosyltransferase